MCVVWVKSIVYSRCDTVDLCDCTDTKNTCKNTENSKQYSKPFPVFACKFFKTFFNCIEWTAKNVAVFFLFAVSNCKHTFSIFCTNTYKSCHPHPEQGTRTTGCNSCCYTDNVTSTDCSRKSCTKSTKA